MPATEPTPDTTLELALAYAKAGIRVLPIRPGQKHPPMQSWQHAATTDPKTITSWFKGLYRECGIGLAMGTQPDGRNLFALDVDEHDPAQSGSDTLAELETIHGPLPDTVRSITGAGGAHHIYNSGDIVVTNGAAGAVGPGLDVRGAGGQIVVAPTIHPNGHPYAWETGYAPDEHPIAPAPAWLLELVAPPEIVLEPESPSVADRWAHTSSLKDTPADQLRDEWDWPTELAARGWQLEPRRRRANGDTHWTRPGKDPREGTSGVLHEGGPFVVFTTDASTAAMWKAGRPGNGVVSLSPLAYVAAYDHNGDLQAAGRALRLAQGHTGPNPTTLDPPVEPDEDDEWAPHDIVAIAEAILDGTRQRETPTILHVDGAQPILYRGRLHSIFGAPGGGKTWIALSAIAEQLQQQQRVLFIDWEDSADGTAARLLDLGCTPTDIAHLDYISPTTALALGILALNHLADTNHWTLVVIDSAGEAMGAAGIDPNADGQVQVWMALAKSLCHVVSTPAVLMLDHIPKNTGDNPAGFAIGSQRKLAAITGAAYRCDTLIEPAIGKPGKLKLVVAKDRLGNRAKGSTAAEAHFEPQDEHGALRITFRISDAQAAHERGEKFRPTVLMERVSRWLEVNPRATRNTIREEVQGGTNHIDTAVAVLVEEGYVTTEEGPRRARLHTVDNPYREGCELTLDPTGTPGHHRDTTGTQSRWDDRDTGTPPPLGVSQSRVPHAGVSQEATGTPAPQPTPDDWELF